MQLEETSVNMTGKFFTSNSSVSLDTTAQKINMNDDTSLSTRKFIHSTSSESGTKSLQFTATLANGSNLRHSPAIDTQRNSLISIENIINDVTTSETTNSGAAKARYVSRTVTLDDGQDAEDLQVFLGAYKPTHATIQVYAKLLHGEDGQDIDDRAYIELTQVTSAQLFSDDENDQDFNEYEYKLPTASMTGSGNEVQYTEGSVTYTGFKYFKIKVVMSVTAGNESKVPRLRDFRAIALQI